MNISRNTIFGAALTLIANYAVCATTEVIDIPDTGHQVTVSNTSLHDARSGFSTHIVKKSFTDPDNLITPPADAFVLTHYPTKLGKMSAYVTPDPKDGQRHPAVI